MITRQEFNEKWDELKKQLNKEGRELSRRLKAGEIDGESFDALKLASITKFEASVKLLDELAEK